MFFLSFFLFSETQKNKWCIINVWDSDASWQQRNDEKVKVVSELTERLCMAHPSFVTGEVTKRADFSEKAPNSRKGYFSWEEKREGHPFCFMHCSYYIRVTARARVSYLQLIYQDINWLNNTYIQKEWVLFSMFPLIFNSALLLTLSTHHPYVFPFKMKNTILKPKKDWPLGNSWQLSFESYNIFSWKTEN